MKNRISILYVALFCAALSAQETGVPAAGQENRQNPAAETDTAQTARAAAPRPAAVQTAAPVSAPATPLTRADSALSVYRSARDSIILTNRKFPRPPKTRKKTDADTVRTPVHPDSALASAAETVRAAWAALGVTPPTQEPPDAVKTAALPPREPGTQTRADAPDKKPFKAQAVLGMIVPLASDLKPWWNTGFYASYRGIDADARFSKGLGVDLSLYTPNKKEYEKEYESKRDSIKLSDVVPMFIVDLGYYLKFYPIDRYKIPYIAGAAGICGAFGGSAKVSYDSRDTRNSVPVEPEDLIDDIYLFHASVGAGADIPVYAGIRVFAEIQYLLRYGLFSIGESGGFVQQIPVRFGVMVPFEAFSEIF